MKILSVEMKTLLQDLTGTAKWVDRGGAEKMRA
jgi:hypothetical protein